MRLIRGEITGFGHYRQVQFDFKEGNQLIFGENEAGKSTLYQFIQGMLFGFPAKRGRKKDYTPQDGTAFGGRLVIYLETYGEVTIERFKQTNRGQAKVYWQNQTGDEKLLAKMLAPLNQSLFQQVFTFQQEQLSQLEGLKENELHDALVSLGISGSRKMMSKRSEYLQESQKIYKPRGQKYPLNQRVMELKQLQQRVNEKLQEEAEVLQLVQRIKTLEQESQEKQQQIQQLESSLLHKKEQQRYFPQYRQWQHLQQQKDDQFEGGAELAAFYQEYLQQTQQIIDLQGQLQASEGKLQLSERYRFYQQHETEIDNLLRQQVSGVRLTDEFQGGLKEQEALFRQLEELEDQYGWSPAAPPPTDAQQLLTLLEEKQQVQAKLGEKARQIQWLEEEVQQQAPAEAAKKKTRSGIILGAGGLLLLGLVGLLLQPFQWAQQVWWGLILLGVAGIGGSIAIKGQQQGRTTGSRLPELQARLAKEQQDYVATQQQLATLEQQFASLGEGAAEMSASQVAEYQSAVQAYHEANQELLDLESKLAQLDQAYGRFMQAFDFLRDWLPLEAMDLMERLTALQHFVEEMQQVKRQEELRPAELIRQQLTEKKAQLQQFLTLHGDLLAQAEIREPAEIPYRLEKIKAAVEGKRRQQELQQLLAPLFPNRITEEALGRQLVETEEQLLEARRLLTSLQEQKQRQELRLQQLQKDGTLDQLRQLLADKETEVQELLLTWASYKAGGALLNDLATEMSQKQLPELLATAGKYLAILTGGAYQQIDFVAGELQVIGGSGRWEIYDLSTGTRDQLVMALRFGYLSLQQDHPLAPVIIDDGWLHYDGRRKQALARLLAEFSQSYQIICLSSDQEMVSYYQRLSQTVSYLPQR